MRGEVERLEVAADRVGQVQRLARHPPVRGERALKRRAAKPAARARAAAARQSSAVALVGQVGDDDVVGDVDGGLLVGVALQRFAQRARAAAAARRRARRRPSASARIARSASSWLCCEQRVEPDRQRLDVELQRLARPAGGRRAGRTRGRPARARPATSPAGSSASRAGTRTSAPSLVTSRPSRSIASTAHSSPASGSGRGSRRLRRPTAAPPWPAAAAVAS